MPPLWAVSRFCEEFHATPARALWEIEHDVGHVWARILLLRDFVRAKEAYTRKPDDLPDGPMKDLIEEFDFEDAAARLTRRRDDSGQ